MAVPSTTRFYRYKVESLNVIFPTTGEKFDVDNKLIVGLMIERDFDNSFFPVTRIDLSLNTELWHKIIANNTTVKFRLRIQRYMYDQNNVASMRTDILNDVFAIFLDDNTPFLSRDEYKKALSVTSTTSSDGSTPATVGGNDVTFYLFKETDLMNSKRITNAVVQNATITDTLAYLLSTNGFNKVLMAPIDNKEVFGEIVLPPLTVLGNLVYLENQFGYYKKGALIFFDLDYTYLLGKTGKCTAWRRGEYKKTVFTIKNSTNAERLSSGSYFDPEKSTTYINVKPEDISMYSPSIVLDQLVGNHRLIIDPATGTTRTLKTAAPQRGDGTYKVMYNKYNNPYMEEAEQTRIEAEGMTMEVALRDIDTEALSPNKEFSFKFEDTAINKSHGGVYRLSKTTVILQSEGDHFKSSMTAAFKK